MIKKLIMTTLITGALLIPGGEAAPKNRAKRQGARIHQGVRSGSLTGREARGLTGAWHRTNRSIRRDRRDGGVFTPRERAKAHLRQDRLSRQIYRQKHDGQTRSR